MSKKRFAFLHPGTKLCFISCCLRLPFATIAQQDVSIGGTIAPGKIAVS